METLLRDLRAKALHLGFDNLGVCSPKASAQMDFFGQWIRNGYHGEMGYLARPDAVKRRGDLADRKSVV